MEVGLWCIHINKARVVDAIFRTEINQRSNLGKKRNALVVELYECEQKPILDWSMNNMEKEKHKQTKREKKYIKEILEWNWLHNAHT